MKTALLVFICCIFLKSSLLAQNVGFESPYEISWVDGAVTAGGMGLSYWGLTLMQDKEAVSEAQIREIDADLSASKSQIPAFDRWSAGYYDHRADQISEFPFYGSFALPLLFLAHERTRNNAPQIGLLYLETMSITGALFAQVNGRVNRMRPVVYNPNAGDDVRMDDKSQNSFYGGHVTATAAASFFTAKVFNDFFPNSPARPYIWAGASVVPLGIGYLRLKAGKHFLSDNLIGYAIGAGVGFLVPHFHKRNGNIALIQRQDLFGNFSMGINYRF